MRAIRGVAVVGLAVALLGLVVIVTVPQETSADTNTWTTDSDWLSGTMDSNVVLQGTGPAAYLELRKADFPDWMKMAPSTVPPRRDAACLAHIDVDNTFLMFGGSGSSGNLGDTWKYSFSADQWTELSLATHPSNRSTAGCAYDPVGQDVVLFGGNDGTAWSTETWKFDAVTSTWSQVFPSGSTPRNFWSTPMTYDSAQRKMVILFRNSVTVQMETWAYDPAANSWANRNPSTSPNARDGHAMVYVAAPDRTLVFSGAEGLTVYCDFWLYAYTPNSWTKVRDCVPNQDPNGRVGAGITSRTDCPVFMYGGFDGVAYPPETWCYEFGFGDWFNPAASGSPGARRNFQLATENGNISVFFGGSNTADGLKNDTWAFAKGYVPSTDAVWTSSTTPVDTGCTNPTYGHVYWNSTTNPTGAILRFQIATSVSPNGPWTFTGPGGLPGAHYTTWGQQIDPVNNNREYFRALAKLRTANGRVTPHLEDLEMTWICPPTAPRITDTNPASGQTNVPLNAHIWVNFSEPMNITTVTWTISGGITAGSSWSNGDRTLELTPSALFRDCTGYTAQITGGKDQNDGLDLVPGSAPNPWTFTTICVNPYVVTTDPVDGAVNVPVTKALVVTFSEPMNTGTVAWTISGGITLAGTWNGNRDVLTLSHGTSFATCTVYTAEITAGNDDQGLPLTAGPVPNPWSFFTVCANPYIVSTSPADGATNVALNAPIVVTFSRAMNPASVNWSFSDPGITFSPPAWSGGDTVLTLGHSSFAQATLYTTHITAGTDTGGSPLVPGPAPNPWSFTTVDLAPYITCESPADGAVDVPLDARILVCFSEAVDPVAISFTITPPIAMTLTWNPTMTNVTIDHATPLTPCTLYTVQVGGVGPGPLPNPWRFTTVCALGSPGGLAVSESPPNSVLLTWRAVTGATGYKVYTAPNRFAAFPSGWTLLTTVATTQYSASGHLTDGLIHYYLVRATSGASDGPNSTMGVKHVLSFVHSPTNTNVAWFSLPYMTTYRRASDIASKLTFANIDVVGKWDVGSQSTLVYYYARGNWRGTDFLINPGDGLFLGVRQPFTWAVVGTDQDATLTFSVHPPPSTNTNWIGLPYTSRYQRASDVTNELTFAKITEFGMWDAATQTTVRWYWAGSAWAGSDFVIPQGAGLYIIVASGFAWTPGLLTPYRP